MSDVTININEVGVLSNTMHEMQSDLQEIAENIRAIQRNLTGKSFILVRSKLLLLANNISTSGNEAANYANVLQESARAYLDAEIKAAGMSDKAANDIAKDANIDGYDSDFERWIKENFKDLVNVAVAGSPLFKFLKNIYDGAGGINDGSAKNISVGALKTLSTVLAFIGKVESDGPSSVTDYLKLLVGIGIKESESTSGPFIARLGESFQKELAKYKIQTGAAENGGSTVKWAGAAAKWIGVVAELVGEGFENYDEFKNSGNWGRMAGETVVESGVDIGIGIGVAALIGATGAPAIAAAIAGAGVVYLANKGCEWVTQHFFGEAKDIGEVVSDLVLDRIEADARYVADRVAQAAEGVRNAAEAVGRGFRDMGRSIAGWFGW